MDNEDRAEGYAWTLTLLALLSTALFLTRGRCYAKFHCRLYGLVVWSFTE